MIEIIVQAATYYGLNPALLLAVCTVESHLQPHVVNVHDGGSPSYGLCQIKLRTARHYYGKMNASELLNASINAHIAAKILRDNLYRYDYDMDCAIAAYNRGSCKKVDGKISNQGYVKKVKRKYAKFKKLYPYYLY